MPNKKGKSSRASTSTSTVKGPSDADGGAKKAKGRDSAEQATREALCRVVYEQVRSRKIVCKPAVACEVIDRRSRSGIKFKNESGLLVHIALCVIIDFIKRNGGWKIGNKFDSQEVVPAVREVFHGYFRGRRSDAALGILSKTDEQWKRILRAACYSVKDLFSVEYA
uniref:Uncharacterized protein n=1 Tax=Palpitomonas bilix TaxID=652834 RepID=A0A7S3DH83_9EUKA|mmetsp:Transcript_37768/g.97443  ORF Transcript_37768/g.97443 Transcript_37768/m.97443 type:complete len:167 (+) Transcript_37768:574-1074(+)